ncbi:MAG: methyltransferase domain-containing protein [Gammaproteobacteria bacterium]|nr:methyltransferase domain-containing protein [Gammaproteobacteria bacterium]
MKDFGPESFGEYNADGYDRSYGNPSDAETKKTVDVLANLAAGGTILELAIGTGRIGLPLAAQGLSVSGIEASAKMVDKLREKPGGDAIDVTIGDMADVGVDGTFDLIYLVFNTLFNLTSQAEQVRCFKNVSKHLSEGGLFVIEAYVPDPSQYENGESLKTVHIAIDRVVLEASVHNSALQTVDYQYIELTENGMRLHPLPVRYVWPSEFDLMAQLAGLDLHQRWAGWDRSPFTASSSSHVSVYKRNK